MNALIVLLVAAMGGFAIVSAIREIRLYTKALKGDELYLVSRRRRNRRLLISLLLLSEAILLAIGFFFFTAETPFQELLFWIFPLLIILILIRLSLQDFRETSRDIDIIFKEARNSAMKSLKKNKRV
jgi:uncharacterized membrane protein YfcA